MAQHCHFVYVVEGRDGGTGVIDGSGCTSERLKDKISYVKQ